MADHKDAYQKHTQKSELDNKAEFGHGRMLLIFKLVRLWFNISIDKLIFIIHSIVEVYPIKVARKV